MSVLSVQHRTAIWDTLEMHDSLGQIDREGD